MPRREVRVLIIEDDPVYRRLLEMALRSTKGPVQFSFDRASNVAEAKVLLARNKYDAAILDLGLPDSFGLETFEEIHRAYPDLPVVISTGTDDEQTALEAIRAGAGDFLTKGDDSFNTILTRTVLYTVEHQASEQTFRQAEKNLRSVINASPDAVVVVDKPGNILFANKAAETLFGESTDKLLGSRFDVDIEICSKRQVQIRRAGGSIATAEMTVTTIEWQGQNVYLAWLHDITRRIAAGDKLERYRRNLKELVRERTQRIDSENELLAVTFSSMSDGVMVVDPENRIIFFNSVAEKLAGWELEPVQDRDLDSLFRVVDARTGKPCPNIVDRVLSSGETERGTDSDVLVTLDGMERPVSITATPVRRKGERIIGIVVVFRDVSQQREIDNMKKDFISSVSHELRTPLTSIKAYTETILDNPEMDKAVITEFLGIVNEESDRLAQLIEDLLEISRLESGTAAMDEEEVDINDIVRRVGCTLEPLAARKNIDLVVECEGPVDNLIGDSGKLESVVTNLGNNAIKFTPDYGTVSICAAERDGNLVLRISDTGMGIPKDSLGKIFDRFYRVPKSSNGIPGTGLGLAIVGRVVEMHNGRIDVESEVNKGTTFTVSIPLAIEESSAPQDAGVFETAAPAGSLALSA